MSTADLFAQIRDLAALGLSQSAITVPAGSNLQAAIDAAPVGAYLLVAPGDYAPIRLPRPMTLATTGALPVRRVAGDYLDDPSAFVRITATGGPAVSLTAPVRLVGFSLTRTDASPPIVSITGDWTSGMAVLDRCWVAGGTLGSRRGIEANGCATVVVGSRVENCWQQGTDAQALASWTGPGPLTVTDCYLEGSTETLLIGGNDPSDVAHQPQNFTLRNSLLTKRTAWRMKPGMVKNTLEIKNCVGFTIEDNVVEQAWVDGQDGYVLVLTPRNQGGGAPYSTVANGVIQRNLFRHGAGGLNVLGTDNVHPSGVLTNVQLRNNRFEDIDASLYGGNGRLVQIVGGPVGLTLDHQTLVGAHLNSFLSFGPYAAHQTLMGFRFTNTFADEGAYGLVGDNTGLGIPTLTYYAPGAVWQNIALIQQAPRTIPYPPGTTYVANEAAALAQGSGAVGYPAGI